MEEVGREQTDEIDNFRDVLSNHLHSQVYFLITKYAEGKIDDRKEAIVFRLFCTVVEPKRLLEYKHWSQWFEFSDSMRRAKECLFIEACVSLAKDFRAFPSTWGHWVDLRKHSEAFRQRMNPFTGKMQTFERSGTEIIEEDYGRSILNVGNRSC